jgi:hypothetical protein
LPYYALECSVRCMGRRTGDAESVAPSWSGRRAGTNSRRRCRGRQTRGTAGAPSLFQNERRLYRICRQRSVGTRGTTKLVQSVFIPLLLLLGYRSMNTKLALSALVAALMLTACAKQEAASPDAAATPPASTEAAPAAPADAAPAAPATDAPAAAPADGTAAPPPADTPAAPPKQ